MLRTFKKITCSILVLALIFNIQNLNFAENDPWSSSSINSLKPINPELIITEILPNSNNSNEVDGFDFIEVYNPTSKPINFNDYRLLLNYSETNTIVAGLSNTKEVIWKPTENNIIIEPQKTAVFWISTYDNTLSTNDFNANYNSNLIEGNNIFKIQTSELINFGLKYISISDNVGNDVCVAGLSKDNLDFDASVENASLKYTNQLNGNPTLTRINDISSSPTPGLIDSSQYITYNGDYGSDSQLPNIFHAFPVKINPTDGNYKFKVLCNDNRVVRSVIMHYRFDNDLDYRTAALSRSDKTEFFYDMIATDFFGKNSMEVYYSVSDGGNPPVFTDKSNITIETNISKDNLQFNLKNGSIISKSKTLSFSSKNFDSSELKVIIDGKINRSKRQKQMVSDAEFKIDVSQVNNYFKNGIVKDGKVLKLLNRAVKDYKTITVPISASKFKFGEDQIISVASGTMSSTTDHKTDENRDDFKIKNPRLILGDGTVYYCKKTDINSGKELPVGDGSKSKRMVSFKFHIEDAKFKSNTIKINTLNLKDGEHTFTLLSPNKDKIKSSVKVDNTPPTISSTIKNGQEIKGNKIINTKCIDKISGLKSVIVKLDNKKVKVPFNTIYSNIKSGNHVLNIKATDKVGNSRERNIRFNMVYEKPTITSIGSSIFDDGTKKFNRLYAVSSNPTNDNISVSFKKAYKYDVSQSSLKVSKGENHIEPPISLLTENETTLSDVDIKSISSKDSDYLINDSIDKFPYHRFQIDVDGSLDVSDEVEVIWSGKSLPGRSVTLYGWNINKNKWTPLSTKVASDRDFELKASVKLGDYNYESKLNFLVQDEVTTNPQAYDFTFAWVSDTQLYASSYNNIFHSMTNWINDKKDEYKIKYLFHSGDIVDRFNDLNQWNVADKAMGVLDDNQVKYGVLAGNHDVKYETSDYTYYNKFFGFNRFSNKDYYGESYLNNKGHYDLVSSNGNDFIMLYMGWGIGSDEIKWMNSVLSKHSDRKAILVFHEYLLKNGKKSPVGNYIYENVVLKNKNVFGVLCGHFHASKTLIDNIDDDGDGTSDRKVYQIISNYQLGPEGGSGYLKLLHFNTRDNSIYVDTYSPYLSDFNYYDYSQDDTDEFKLDFNLTSQTKRVATDYFNVNIYTSQTLKTKDKVKSGSVLYHDVELMYNPEYWYLTAIDKYGGYTKSDVQVLNIN